MGHLIDPLRYLATPTHNCCMFLITQITRECQHLLLCSRLRCYYQGIFYSVYVVGLSVYFTVESIQTVPLHTLSKIPSNSNRAVCYSEVTAATALCSRTSLLTMSNQRSGNWIPGQPAIYRNFSEEFHNLTIKRG